MSNVLRPRAFFGIPVAGAFYEVMHEKLGKVRTGDQLQCDPKAWAKHSSSHDFHVTDSLGYIWDYRLSFPLVLGSCLSKVPGKSMWILSLTHCMPHPAIAWNTLAMVRLELQEFIPTTWHEIAAASLTTWEEGTDRNLSCPKTGEDMLVSRQSG